MLILNNLHSQLLRSKLTAGIDYPEFQVPKFICLSECPSRWILLVHNELCQVVENVLIYVQGVLPVANFSLNQSLQGQ